MIILMLSSVALGFALGSYVEWRRIVRKFDKAEERAFERVKARIEEWSAGE